MNVYLDNSATTPLLPEVVKTMASAAGEFWGNPSSPYRAGRQVRFRVEVVREKIAGQLGCSPSEIIFTSGGTESNNLAVLGMASALRNRGNHIIASAVEHPSLLRPLRHLEQQGFHVTTIQPDDRGHITAIDVERALTDQTVIVAVMDTNNETGIRYPVREIAELCRGRGLFYHCDAVQTFGKFPIDVRRFNAHTLSLSGHKIFGPKGTGVLYIRSQTPVDSIIFGGGQEFSRRPGTENTPGIFGLGAAVDAFGDLQENLQKMKQMRDYFEENIRTIYPPAEIIGEKVERSPYISNIAFNGMDNTALLMNLDMAGIAVSVGSACSSGSIEPSPVLRSMGLPEEIITSAIRFSYSVHTTGKELDYTLEQLETILKRRRDSKSHA